MNTTSEKPPVEDLQPTRHGVAEVDELETLYQLPSHERPDEYRVRVGLPPSYGFAALESFTEKSNASRKHRLSAKNIVGKINAVEERQENFAQRMGEAVRTKNASRQENGKTALSEKYTNRAAKAIEIAAKSGPQFAIGAAAIFGTVITGGGLAVVGSAAFGARTVVRGSRGTRRATVNNEKGLGYTAKLTTESERKRDQYAVKAANVLQAPERIATRIALNFMRNTDKEVTDRRLLTATAIGAVAGSIVLRKFAAPVIHFAEHAAMNGAKFVEQNAVHAIKGLDSQLEGTAYANPTSPTAGSTGTNLNTIRNYALDTHPHDRQADHGLFDGTERNSAETDTHVLQVVENRPSLMAEVLEVHDKGNKDFSVSDVNHNITAETHGVGASHGEYSKTGVNDVHKLELSWKAHPGKILTNTQAHKMLEKYNLINHGTHGVEGADGTEVFSAGKFDYRPDLGDKIYAKELGNGRTVFFKVNERDPSRDCLNCLTLVKKPPVGHSPVFSVPVTPPDNHHFALIPEHPTPEVHKPKPGHDFIVRTEPPAVVNHPKPTPTPTPTPTGTPPAGPPTGPPAGPPAGPPTIPLTPKGPDAGAYGSTPGVSDHLGNNGEIHGPGDLKPATTPPDQYTPPTTPQPQVGDVAPQVPGSAPTPGRLATSSPDGPTILSPDPTIPGGNGADTTNSGSSGGAGGV